MTDFDSPEANNPNRWRKRPVEITAQRMTSTFHVHTLEGVMRGNAGDWLITGVKGEQYPCADDIFRATYESADDPASTPEPEPDDEPRLSISFVSIDPAKQLTREEARHLCALIAGDAAEGPWHDAAIDKLEAIANAGVGDEREFEPAAAQIDRLAEYIMAHVPGEPSENEGAVDTAIRVLRERAIILPSGPIPRVTLYHADPNAERIYETDPEECIEDALECRLPEDWPTEMKIYAWVPMVLDQRRVNALADGVIENLREHWDDQDWADPEESVQFTDEFERDLLAVLKAHLPRQPVWGHERDPKQDVTINLLADIRALDDDKLDAEQRKFLAHHADKETPC